MKKEVELKIEREFLEDDKLIEIEKLKKHYEKDLTYQKEIVCDLESRLKEYENKLNDSNIKNTNLVCLINKNYWMKIKN